MTSPTAPLPNHSNAQLNCSVTPVTLSGDLSPPTGNRIMRRKAILLRTGDRRGATVVEMALVAPIFFLLVFAIVEFGRAVMIKHSLTEAARAGARTAALASTINTSKAESAAQDYLQQTLTGSFDLSQCRINISPDGLGTLDTGTTVTARVEVDFDDVTWITPSFLNNAVLRGEASMTKE